MAFIRIRKDALSKPIFETNDASVIEFYDSRGTMNALLVRQLSDDMWALTTKVDPDWEAALVRFGYINVKASPAEFLASLKQ